MCGIVGIVAQDELGDAAGVGGGRLCQDIYDALTVLQHRGQDAAGMVTSDGTTLHLRKGNGLVRDVFRQEHMQRLVGQHRHRPCALPDRGIVELCRGPADVRQLALRHYLGAQRQPDQRRSVESRSVREDLRHINTNSDSEVLLNVLAHELQQQRALNPSRRKFSPPSPALHKRCRGAYAAVAMIIGPACWVFETLTAFDRWCTGAAKRNGHGLHDRLGVGGVGSAGFELHGQRAPGRGGVHHQRRRDASPGLRRQTSWCRASSSTSISRAQTRSWIDISVYKSRLRMGEHLATRILQQYRQNEHDIDVVIPIPDTGRTAALPLAHSSTSNFAKASSRTATSAARSSCRAARAAKSVRQKLTSIELEFATRTCCWSMTPSSVAPRRNRSSRWPGKRAPEGLHGLGCAGAALPERLRHRHAVRKSLSRTSVAMTRWPRSSVRIGWCIRTSRT